MIERRLGFSGFVTLFLCVCPVRAHVYDYTALPQGHETFTTAHFRIYVPDQVPMIRGIHVYLNPHLQDSRPIVGDPLFCMLCESVDFALMGAQLESMYMESGIGNAVLRTLAAFADSSGHPELAHSTLFFDGWSWGGQFSYHFTLWLPERVLGFVTHKGGYHSTEPAGDAIQVPGYLLVGEHDLPRRIENLTSVFEDHRPLGARWVLAMQPGASHERVTDRTLLDDFFRTVVEHRLPDEIPLDEPPGLRTIPESIGWLGNRHSHLVGSFTCYDAPIDSACWFASHAGAAAWQAFVSDGAAVDTIPCDPASLDPDPAPHPLRLSFPNPFTSAASLRLNLQQPGPVRLSVHDITGRSVCVLLDAYRQPGTLEIPWYGHDGSGQRLPGGVYLVRC